MNSIWLGSVHDLEFEKFVAAYGEAHWEETFQVQPMQQGLHRQETSRKAWQSPPGLNITVW